MWAVVQSVMHRLVLSVQLQEKQRGGLRGRVAQKRPVPAANQTRLAKFPQLPAAHILFLVFSGNFIGIVCARTLHYQFYSW